MPLNARMARLSQDDWCCAALQGVFSEEFYRKIVVGLEGLPWAEARQSFYRQREVNLKDVPYYRDLFTSQIRKVIAGDIGRFFGVALGADFDIAAHKMVPGDYIGVHTDENSHGETHRMTIALNNDWSAAEGGVLLALNDGALSSLRDAWLPTANNGFLFEISRRSFHAVSPIVGSRARHSLIITFREVPGGCSPSQPTWSPFPLLSDLRDAASTASHMGFDKALFSSPYRFVEFDSADDLATFVSGSLRNAPTNWSYTGGTSMNVDQLGRQPKGTDKDRVAAVGQLRRRPPIIIVRARDGSYSLVDGSHRLSHAVDLRLTIGAVIFSAGSPRPESHQ